MSSSDVIDLTSPEATTTKSASRTASSSRAQPSDAPVSDASGSASRGESLQRSASSMARRTRSQLAPSAPAAREAGKRSASSSISGSVPTETEASSSSSVAATRSVIDLTSPDDVRATAKRARRTDVDALIATDEEFARKLQRELEAAAATSAASSASTAGKPVVVVDVDEDAALARALVEADEQDERRREQAQEELARRLLREEEWRAARLAQSPPVAPQTAASRSSSSVFRPPALVSALASSASGLMAQIGHYMVGHGGGFGDDGDGDDAAGYHHFGGRRRNRHSRHSRNWRHRLHQLHQVHALGGGGAMLGGQRLTGEALSMAMRDFTPADYETLLALDDAVPTNRGADAEAIEQLPQRVVKAGDAVETCCICMEEMGVGSSVMTLPCTHTYHADCIRAWLVVNRRCPVDKVEI
jgi:hypothetical protein